MKYFESLPILSLVDIILAWPPPPPTLLHLESRQRLILHSLVLTTVVKVIEYVTHYVPQDNEIIEII